MWAVEGLVSVCRPEGRKGLELNVIMVQWVGNPIAYTPQAQESDVRVSLGSWGDTCRVCIVPFRVGRCTVTDYRRSNSL